MTAPAAVRSLTLRLPAPPAGLSANARRRQHWSTTATLTRGYRILCLLSLNGKHTTVPIPAVAHVSLELCSGRRAPDVDSIASLAKPALDALVEAGVLVDDSPRYLREVLYSATRHPRPCHCDGALVVTLQEVIW